VQALPHAAFFVVLEAAVGGTIALLWLHLRGEVSRGFVLFTGVCFLVSAALAIWLRSAFAPFVSPDVNPTAVLWFAAERALSLAFVVLLAVYLIGMRIESWAPVIRLISPVVPFVGLGGLWSAALVDASAQLLGLGTPLAVLAGALALGSALTSLSLGHWYLVSPTLSVRPLIQVTFLCMGALIVQTLLLPLFLFLPEPAVLAPGPRAQGVQLLFSEYSLFFGVRVVFGLLVPLVATLMTWRTARIRSLDSATGLLYVVVALVLAGEITARTLYFLTGVAT
jgi:hypothetical protein